jgi:cytochrome c oxidase assembly protein subunit 15
MNYVRFRKLSLFQIIFAVLIILWGAWVRISGSGDGCGVHWPLCQGYIVPSGQYMLTLQTWIEYFHRAKSGLFGMLVIIQCIVAFRLFTKGTAVRFFALGSLVFTFIEAILGAILVLGSFVDSDTSIGRVVIMSLHLINTLVLLLFLTGTYYFSLNKNCELMLAGFLKSIYKEKKQLLPLLLIVTIAITGAWAALSTTLFPSSSLFEGLSKDIDPASHLVLRLRIFHPILATLLAFATYSIVTKSINKTYVTTVNYLLLAQVMFGLFTLAFLSPTWMKICHLLLADILWIVICLHIFASVIAHCTEAN